MKRMLTENLGLKILAVVFSIALWFISINITDPVSSDSYTVTVQLQNMSTLTNAGKYVEVLDGSDRVRVTVRGSRSVLQSFSNSNIIATADVSKIIDDQKIPIEVTTTKESDKIESIRAEQQYVEVYVENMGKTQLPITVVTQNDPAEGYIVGNTSTAQNVVILSGPESLIDTVKYAKVEVNVDRATSDVNVSLPIHLYNEDDVMIDSSKITMSKTEVSTTVSMLQTKELPVNAIIAGSLLDGYVLGKETKYSQNTVLVAGKPNVVKNLTSLDIDGVIDITGNESDVIATVNVKDYLPEGVNIVGDNTQTITITVPIERAYSRDIEVQKKHIHVVNTPEAYTAELAMQEESIVIPVKGLRTVVESINDSEIVVMVDIQKYMDDNNITEIKAGYVEIPVSITLPEEVAVTRDVKVGVNISNE